MSNETKKRLSISQKVLYAKNPEMRGIHRMHTIRLIKEGHTRMSNTLPERQIKAYLHTKNLIEGKDWIHQHYINDIEHKYVADFILPKIKTIIECDGNYFHANDDSIKNELSNKQKYRVTIDDLRTKELREQGYIVLRFWESDIKKKFEKISQSLDTFINIYKGDYHRW
jgi:very-short-patch-repair endonuclease